MRFFAFNTIFILCFIGALCSELDVEEECGSDEKCVNKHLDVIIERIDREESLPLFGGLQVIKTLDRDPVNSEGKTADGILERLRKYVATHDLVYQPDGGMSPRSDEEARTSKLKKLILPLLVALKLKLIIFLPMIVSALALISIKGVFAGLFSLFLSGLTAVKSLTESKNEPVAAILATPVHHPHHHHHHDLRWGRHDVQEAPTQMPIEAYNLPYAGYQSLPQALP